MRTAQKIVTAVLVAGLGATIYGIVRSGESANAANTKAKKAAAGQLVDQSALATARQLAQLADTPDEQAIAKEALTLGDRELDLAFDIALREADAHPPVLSKDAEEIQARLQQAQKLQQTLQAQVTQLTTEAAKASGAKTPLELLDQADKALYGAKRGGRNRVVGWDEIRTEGEITERVSNIAGVVKEQQRERIVDGERILPART